MAKSPTGIQLLRTILTAAAALAGKVLGGSVGRVVQHGLILGGINVVIASAWLAMGLPSPTPVHPPTTPPHMTPGHPAPAELLPGPTLSSPRR